MTQWTFSKLYSYILVILQVYFLVSLFDRSMADDIQIDQWQIDDRYLEDIIDKYVGT